MTKNEYLIKKFTDFYKGYNESKMDFFYHPSIARIEPFKIADGLYYVGDKKVCIHLVDTGDGLILIDSGYLGTTHMLVDSIWRAGFDPADIKIILHTHGHSDHYGASSEFARMYGCRLAISRIDSELVSRGAVDGKIDGKLYPLATAPEFDMMLDDGDTVELGDTSIKCILSPGHTEGVFSLFFTRTYEGKSCTVGMFGGAGTNAITLPYLVRNGYPLDMPDRMLETIDMLKKIPVDIHLGNHPGNNHTLEKRKKMIEEGGNPFIDKNSWGDFLNSLEAKVKAVIEDNKRLDAEADEFCKCEAEK